jgi:hypothetical protein
MPKAVVQEKSWLYGQNSAISVKYLVFRGVSLYNVLKQQRLRIGERRGTKMKKASVIFALLWIIGFCQAGTLYVDDSAAGAGNGASWADAYRFLQDALTAAVSGDTIRMAQGIYNPDANSVFPDGTGDRTATFTLKNGVTILGGYAGNGLSDPDARDIGLYATILSGDLNGNDGDNFANNTENSYHVVTASSTDASVVLDGVTITAGNANPSNYYGAAVYNESGNPVLRNCRIVQNYSYGRGAFYNVNGSPAFIDCLFSGNTSKYNAGALYNTGTNNVVLTRCVFVGNKTTSGMGGAIFHGTSSVLTAVDTIFGGNTANSSGGTLYSVSTTSFTNCVFTGNRAEQGGGIYQGSGLLTLVNCTFSENVSTYYPYGAGLYTRDNTAAITNCIFWGNHYGTQPADENDQINYFNCVLQLNYSCVQGWSGAMGGTGNIGGDPLLADANGSDDVAGTVDDDLRLPLGVSPCIDSGNNTAVPAGVLTDIAGHTRFYDDSELQDTGAGIAPIVDMGAYEAVPLPEPQIGLTPEMLSFKTIKGSQNPEGQLFSIRNRGEGTLNWSISEDCQWLDVQPMFGSSEGETDIVTVTVDGSLLEAGLYEYELIVSDEAAGNNPQSVWVAFDVIPPWKHQIAFPDEPFRTAGPFTREPGWVKFTIKTENPDTVYFQDGREYLFHYDWATEWLDPFIGMTAGGYEQVTLYAQGQQAALGAVIMAADTAIREYGIQFIRYEAYSKEQIAAMFNAVKSSIAAEPDVQAFYFPAYEQMAAARENQAWFEAQGIPISSTGRWAEGNACYSSGWAMGVLKYVVGTDIQAAYASGQLRPEDILLTDGVPAEVPFVAGILTLEPSTPSSHVAILAQTFGIPFGHLALADDAALAQGLVGRLVMVSVGQQNGNATIGIKDMTGLLSEQEKAEILAIKTPRPLELSAMQECGNYAQDADELRPEDIGRFGGKAANFGLLRQTIPDNSPKAVAFSFRLWNEFLTQTLMTGRTLREEINQRLSAYTYPPSNLPALYADLEYIRENLFKNTAATSFTPSQTSAVLSILQDPNYCFEADRNIRFRSSTNVEDANEFSGAGLYDSFSGCLADDIDGDTSGPCICDPVESKERGVFRAIRKVFASFYNDNAFLERLRHGVNEDQVGMAMLVHHSSPDPFELANGVATLEKKQGDTNRYITLVTQKGAVSVANPEDGSIPEEVTVLYRSPSDMEITLVRSSNLVILGQTILDWMADYRTFAELLAAASERFETVTGKSEYLLDFEYKKLLPGGSLPAGGLAVKQIREIPKSEQGMNINTAFLVNQPVTFATFQGEGANVYAKHRLKSRWTLETKSMWLTPENLARGFYEDVTLEYAADGRIRTLTGKLPLLPYASHTFSGTTATDSWRMHHLYNPRTYTLTTQSVKSRVGTSESPIVTLSDFGQYMNTDVKGLGVQAVYSRPGEPTADSLYICSPLRDGLYQQRSFSGGGIGIITRFYYADWESMILTYPLGRYIETTITGLTTLPIVLHGYYSQTFSPGHHNFSEEHLFEPRLEPGISQAILGQLKTAKIDLIHVAYNNLTSQSTITTLSSWDLPFLTADIDEDGCVDLSDLAELGRQWLEQVCDECGGADLTGDGGVNMKDLLEMAVEWYESL